MSLSSRFEIQHIVYDHLVIRCRGTSRTKLLLFLPYYLSPSIYALHYTAGHCDCDGDQKHETCDDHYKVQVFIEEIFLFLFGHLVIVIVIRNILIIGICVTIIARIIICRIRLVILGARFIVILRRIIIIVLVVITWNHLILQD